MIKKNKISFCTVCMNRLHHLKDTLPKNIANALPYKNVEFVVLNYNSNDGLDDWIKTDMAEYLESGVLKYFKTTEPENFHMSHSKNVVARCAEGDIICNVDADNFIGKGFTEFINTEFIKDNEIYLSVSKNMDKPDCYGRICVKASDFNKISGYDENMLGYGFEDFDLRNRLDLLLLKKVNIINSDYLKAIQHLNEERLENEKNAIKLEHIFIRYINYYTSSLLYLFKNNKYFLGSIISNRLLKSQSIENIFLENRIHEYHYGLKNDIWKSGKWRSEKQKVILEEFTVSTKNRYTLIISNKKYIKIENKDVIQELIMFFSQISNRVIMKNNEKGKQLVVNNKSYGKANLIKNFKETLCLK